MIVEQLNMAQNLKNRNGNANYEYFFNSECSTQKENKVYAEVSWRLDYNSWPIKFVAAFDIDLLQVWITDV